MLDQICIFTRSYKSDFPLLPYLYRSLDKHAKGFAEVVLVVEEQDAVDAKKLVPSWVSLRTEKHFAHGTIQHKYTKLTADNHTSKNYVFHIDSDSLFVRSPKEIDLFARKKPILEIKKYSDILAWQDSEEHKDQLRSYVIKNVLPNALLADLRGNGVANAEQWLAENLEIWIGENFDLWFDRWFERWKKAFGLDVWREGTEFAIGLPQQYEYSCRPEKVYPRDVYPLARQIIEKKHEVTFEEFIVNRVGAQREGVPRQKYFSDLNFIGAVLYHHMFDAIEWVDVVENASIVRLPIVKQFISYDMLTDGYLTKEAVELLEEALA